MVAGLQTKRSLPYPPGSLPMLPEFQNMVDTMDRELSLDSAHFQLTGRCNLACVFCGQNKGMLASEVCELPVELWLKLAEEIKTMSPRTPELMLWGGEPLLYPGFDDLAAELHKRGFKLGMVTNATLLHEHLDAVAENIDSINISVDGTRTGHDAMRGNGVFDKLSANLKLLNPRRKGKLTFLTTVSDLNVKGISQLPFELAKLGCDEIVLQPLMYLTGEEIASYRSYSCQNWQKDYPELAAWQREEDAAYLTELRKELETVQKTAYPLPVRFTPHRYPSMEECPPCRAPWHRVHIRHDGEVGFCTDYFGFSAGNIQKNTLREIFYGERAALYRKAVEDNALTTCDHCPWRLQ
jgi:MoaA/NifB/PqqE/SkfB family radical SAM enzyme